MQFPCSKTRIRCARSVRPDLEPNQHVWR